MMKTLLTLGVLAIFSLATPATAVAAPGQKGQKGVAAKLQVPGLNTQFHDISGLKNIMDLAVQDVLRASGIVVSPTATRQDVLVAIQQLGADIDIEATEREAARVFLKQAVADGTVSADVAVQVLTSMDGHKGAFEGGLKAPEAPQKNAASEALQRHAAPEALQGNAVVLMLMLIVDADQEKAKAPATAPVTAPAQKTKDPLKVPPVPKPTNAPKVFKAPVSSTTASRLNYKVKGRR